MPDVWRIYRVKKCSHTHPPKDKFVVIVCRESRCLGFLINSEINQFTAKKPHLFQCQVSLKKADYHFLFHDSYLDCARLYPFDDGELVVGLDLVNAETKAEIKTVVSKAKTIARRYVKLILMQ